MIIILPDVFVSEKKIFKYLYMVYKYFMRNDFYHTCTTHIHIPLLIIVTATCTCQRDQPPVTGAWSRAWHPGEWIAASDT